MNVVKDLSNSFNPVPKNKTNKISLIEESVPKKDIKKKQIKQKSNKLVKLEKNRFSILTDNLKICYICNKKLKEDTHEIFGGSNRRKSMVWGLVIPICRGCHAKWKTDKELRKKYQQEAQRIFEKEHSHELFMKEFKKNYL